MPSFDVPVDLQTAAEPGAVAHEVHQRKARAGVVIGDLNVVAALPDGAGFEFEAPTRPLGLGG